MFKYFSFIFSLGFIGTSVAQVPQITGFIKDAESGEAIQGAIISDSGGFYYTYSNREGYYNLGIRTGKHTILYTASGYSKQSFVLDVYNSTTVNADLEKMDEYEDDTFSNENHAIRDYRSGHVSPLINQIQNMPSLMCEQDPIKFLQYLPGVSGGFEGLAGMYVRGGNADQNLITMDGLPVYGNGHIFGFLSQFNPDVVRDVQFYRGVMPARYGGRAGSATDITTLDGGKDMMRGSFSADPLAMKFNINGPIDQKGKTTLTLGMRRSWIDLFLPKSGNNYLFYTLHDYNAKVVFNPDENNKISVWVYNGRDKFALKFSESFTDSLNRQNESKQAIQIKWQNTLAGVNFSHRFSERHYGNFIVGISRYSYQSPLSLEASVTSDTSADSYKIQFDQSSSITDLIAKANMEYTLNGNNNLRYGIEAINHSFVPSTVFIALDRNGNSVLDTTYGLSNKQKAQEASVYGEWESNLGVGFKMNIGARLWVYSSRERTYFRPEPRIMFSQLLEGKKALKFGFSMANQGIHQLSSVNGNLPNDVWFPTSGNFSPQQNIQITAGYYKPWRNGIEFSLDIYQKWLKGITDIKSDEDDNLKTNYWEGMVAQGSGTAQGVELMAMKKTGRLSGLVSYTWSKSNREIADINFGNAFPFRWDRRHKGVIQGFYLVNEAWKINFALVVMTGNAVSVPTGKYVTVDGSFVYDYSEKNNYRMPLYRRFDIGFTKEIHPDYRRLDHQYFGLNVYNFFSFNNPVSVQLDRQSSAVTKAIGISYFPIIPTAFYRWVF